MRMFQASVCWQLCQALSDVQVDVASCLCSSAQLYFFCDRDLVSGWSFSLMQWRITVALSQLISPLKPMQTAIVSTVVAANLLAAS